MSVYLDFSTIFNVSSDSNFVLFVVRISFRTNEIIQRSIPVVLDVKRSPDRINCYSNKYKL